MDIDCLKLIEENGLSVRMIPLVVEERYNLRHFDRFKNDPKYSSVDIVDNTTILCKRIPEYAGFWMSKKVDNTSSMVSWSISRDNLAQTLSESVKKCMGM